MPAPCPRPLLSVQAAGLVDSSLGLQYEESDSRVQEAYLGYVLLWFRFDQLRFQEG